MLKLATLVLSFALITAPGAQAVEKESSPHEDAAASPEAKKSAPGSEHAEADTQGHAPHKPRHGANLNLLSPPPAQRQFATRPSLPTLTSPAALASVPGTSVVLKWTASKNAETHHIQVATDPNFKWMIVDQPLLNATEFEVKNLQAGNQYFWRVAGMKNSNIAEYMKGDFVSSSFDVK